MLVEPNADGCLVHDGRECGLAHHKRVAAQIVPIQFDQIEGMEEHAGIIPAVPDKIEGSDAAFIAGDRFTIDKDRDRSRDRASTISEKRFKSLPGRL